MDISFFDIPQRLINPGREPVTHTHEYHLPCVLYHFQYCSAFRNPRAHIFLLASPTSHRQIVNLFVLFSVRRSPLDTSLPGSSAPGHFHHNHAADVFLVSFDVIWYFFPPRRFRSSSVPCSSFPASSHSLDKRIFSPETLHVVNDVSGTTGDCVKFEAGSHFSGCLDHRKGKGRVKGQRETSTTRARDSTNIMTVTQSSTMSRHAARGSTWRHPDREKPCRRERGECVLTQTRTKWQTTKESHVL